MRTIALQKPVLNPIAAFDATEDKEYTFVVSGGGDLWNGVLITIEDNTDPSNPNIEVFTLTQTTTAVIPADTLVNNHQYQATIKTTTATTKASMTSANSSKASVSIQFYCYSQPTFEFTNIVPDGVITSSMYAFNISYVQTEGEYLSTYRIILYDVYDAVLKDSGWLDAPEQTISDGTVSCNIVYSIEGFNDDDQYRIQAYGITMEDTEISTDIIPFSIDYTRMRQYSELYAINHCEDGNIAVGSDINVVKGQAYKEPVQFYPSNEVGTEADLRNNGVVWANVIDSDDFSVFLQFRAPVQNLPHLILTSLDETISETTFIIDNVADDIVFNNIIAKTRLYSGSIVTPIYISWASTSDSGEISLVSPTGAVVSVEDFIAVLQGGNKVEVADNHDYDGDSSGYSNYRYKIDGEHAYLAFDVEQTALGDNRTIIISDNNGYMSGYQNQSHTELSDYSPLPEGGSGGVITSTYSVGSQQLLNVNYTIDSTIYGFMIRRVNGVVSTEFTMLHEPIEALTNHYIYTTWGGTINVEVTDDREVIIKDGFSAVDDGNGNITLTATKTVSVIDMSNNGNIIIGNYNDNGWLTGIYLTDDNAEIPIRFKLGSETEPKDVEDLEDGDTYLWAFTEDDSIDLRPENFEIIGDILYYRPNHSIPSGNSSNIVGSGRVGYMTI